MWLYLHTHKHVTHPHVVKHRNHTQNRQREKQHALGGDDEVRVRIADLVAQCVHGGRCFAFLEVEVGRLQFSAAFVQGAARAEDGQRIQHLKPAAKPCRQIS